MLSTQSDSLYEFSMSSAWDITTLSLLASFSVKSESISPEDIYIKPDGTRAFVTEIYTDSVLQYALNGAPTITFPGSIEVDASLSPPLLGQKTALKFVTSDAGTSYQLIARAENLT